GRAGGGGVSPPGAAEERARVTQVRAGQGAAPGEITERAVWVHRPGGRGEPGPHTRPHRARPRPSRDGLDDRERGPGGGTDRATWGERRSEIGRASCRERVW